MLCNVYRYKLDRKLVGHPIIIHVDFDEKNCCQDENKHDL